MAVVLANSHLTDMAPCVASVAKMDKMTIIVRIMFCKPCTLRIGTACYVIAQRRLGVDALKPTQGSHA